MLYASRTRHGIWRYRRAVPEPLREVAGRREYVVSLETRDDEEAARRHAKVHLEAEKQFKVWRAQAAGAPVQTWEEDEWAKGLEFLKRNRLEYVPLERLKADDAQQVDGNVSEYDRRLAIVDDQLGIDTYDEETRDAAIAASLEARAAFGSLRPPALRLSGALRLYFAEKAADLSLMSKKAARGFRLEKERVISELRKTLGQDKPLNGLTRADALAYRDHLLVGCKLSTSTTNKYIRVAHTIIGTAITHHNLSMQNPFRALRVADGIPDRDRRSHLAGDDIKLLLGSRRHLNEQLGDILMLLMFTGARLNEIAGLEIDDVQLHSTAEGPPYLWIRPNHIRSLKSKSSRRRVPLIGHGLRAATDALARSTGQERTGEALFPRYGRDGGGDAASAALMKYLRRLGISDRRKVVHSIRHSVKQALRDVGCPKDVRDAIQGHSITDVAETYGSGVGLEAKREWLQAAMELLDV
jgi:integrase